MTTRMRIATAAVLAIPPLIFVAALLYGKANDARPVTAKDLPALTNFMSSVTTNRIVGLNLLHPLNGLAMVKTDNQVSEAHYYVLKQRRGWRVLNTWTNESHGRWEQLQTPEAQKEHLEKMMAEVERRVKEVQGGSAEGK
jgi:hypothetical protein